MQNKSIAAHRLWNAALGAVILIWLITAVAVNATAVGGRIGPVSFWANIHTLTIGVITTAVVVYSAHFTATLTRGPQISYAQLGSEIAIIQASLFILLTQPPWTTTSTFAACAIAVVASWHAVTLTKMIRRAFVNQLAVTSWAYVVASCLLVLAIIFAVTAQYGFSHDAFIAAHSRAAVWGFAWTAILGTSLTLLPTLEGAQVAPRVRRRCPQVLILHGSAVALAAGCLSADYVRAAGVFLLVSTACSASLLQPTLTQLLRVGAPRSAAAVLVGCGVAWMFVCLIADGTMLAAGHPGKGLDSGMLVSLLGAGLVQTLLGALSHLLPVLTGRPAARHIPARGLFWRVTLFNIGGVVALASFPTTGGAIMVAAATWHVVQLGDSLLRAGRSA